MRQGSTKQIPVGSTAVRALSALGNGALSGTSRPSTPIAFINSTGSAFTTPGFGSGETSALSNKISKLVAERQSQRTTFNTVENIGKIMETSPNQNGKNDSWKEDQEVSNRVTSERYFDVKICMKIILYVGEIEENSLT